MLKISVLIRDRNGELWREEVIAEVADRGVAEEILERVRRMAVTSPRILKLLGGAAMKLPRAFCSVCLVVVALRKNGSLREHRSAIPPYEYPCRGSAQPPRKDD